MRSICILLDLQTLKYSILYSCRYGLVNNIHHAEQKSTLIHLCAQWCCVVRESVANSCTVRLQAELGRSTSDVGVDGLCAMVC